MEKPSCRQILAFVLCALTLIQAPLALAQVPGMSAKPLLTGPVSGDGTREATVLWIELAPGAAVPRHTHPGDEYATVVEGALELRVADQEPRRVIAGQSYHNPKGVPHETKNTGDGIARIVATFVVEKNLPMTSPAPAQ